MFLDTAADYIEESRRMLQDRVVPYRYADDTILKALQQGVYEAKRLRADLFLPDPQAPKLVAVSTADMSWLDERYREPMLYYVIGHLEAYDAEPAQDTRAQGFLGTFQARLVQTLSQTTQTNISQTSTG